jgi:hypothetical protein
MHAKRFIHPPPLPPRQAPHCVAWRDLPDLTDHHIRRRHLTRLRWMFFIATAGCIALSLPLLWPRIASLL